jgi:metal-responsive CopG/Arc/MetJ family transcriptional regulator
MNTVRVNITLPSEITEMLKDVNNKSGFIAEAIRDRIEREKKAYLIRELTEGYKASKREDKQLTEDWDATSGDGIG